MGCPSNVASPSTIHESVASYWLDGSVQTSRSRVGSEDPIVLQNYGRESFGKQGSHRQLHHIPAEDDRPTSFSYQISRWSYLFLKFIRSYIIKPQSKTKRVHQEWDHCIRMLVRINLTISMEDFSADILPLSDKKAQNTTIRWHKETKFSLRSPRTQWWLAAGLNDEGEEYYHYCRSLSQGSCASSLRGSS